MKYSEFIKENNPMILEELETPENEYRRQKDAVDKNIEQINTLWQTIKKHYEEQLKKNPKGWAGIGRGSELGDFLVDTSKIVKHLMNTKNWFRIK